MPHTVTISIAYSFAKDLFHHVEVTSYEDNFMFIYYSYISIRFVRFPSMPFLPVFLSVTSDDTTIPYTSSNLQLCSD